MFGPIIGYFCATLCAATVAITPPSAVTVLGMPVGQYVDNEVPNQCAVVQEDKTLGWPLVIAGRAPGGGPVCPGALMAREWYPFGCGDPRSWGRIPAAQAYILQWHFHWPGCRRATAKQRRHILAGAERHHPKLILWF